MSTSLLHLFAEASLRRSLQAADDFGPEGVAFLPLLEMPPDIVLPALDREITGLRGDKARLGEGLHRLLTIALGQSGSYWPTLALQWLAQASVPFDGTFARLCRQRLDDYTSANSKHKKLVIRLLEQWDEQHREK